MDKNVKMDYMEPGMEVICLKIIDVVTSSTDPKDPYETEGDIF